MTEVAASMTWAVVRMKPCPSKSTPAPTPLIGPPNARDPDTGAEAIRTVAAATFL